MASLKSRNGNFSVVFYWGGKQFTRSLETNDKEEAAELLGRLKSQIRAVRQGTSTIPEGADSIEWLLSAGKRTSPVEVENAGVRTLGDLIDRYVKAMPDGSTAKTTRRIDNIRYEHLKRELGSRTALANIGLETLQAYMKKRGVGPVTLKKELSILRTAWRWANKASLAPPPPSFVDLRYAKEPDKEPFRHAAEIRALIESDQSLNEATAWESLVLTMPEVRSILAYVAEHWSHHPWFVDAMTIAAYTGARRSELCRMRAADVDLNRMELTIRDKKRVRDKSEGRRTVQIAKALKPTLERLKKRGGFLIQWKGFRDERLATALSNQWADEAHPAKSPWKHVKGFHVLRHSFASNLAAAGVSQSLIDAWMGHQTEEMRRRYRHFFPAEKQRAIEALG